MKLEKLVLIKEIIKDVIDEPSCLQCKNNYKCMNQGCQFSPSEDVLELLARKIADEVL